MFVLLKELSGWQRAACAVLAVLAVIVAWQGVRAPFGEHFAEESQGADRPVAVPQEVEYDLQSNWPFGGGENLFGYRKNGDICVLVMACSPGSEVLKHYILFAENAAQKGYPLQDLYVAESLADWRGIAVSNVCFIDEWSAYIAGALLWYAYDDGSDDISTYNRAITQACPESEVFDRPQP